MHFPRVLLCLLAATSARAQSIEAEPTAFPYAIETWTIQDGLPQNDVTALHQTRNGKLWIATFGGLARFDGHRFETFDLTTHPGMRSNRIKSLCETRDGTLWIGTENRGLVRLRDGEFTAFGKHRGLPHSHVRTLFEDASGRLWIGTPAGLSWVEGERILNVEGLTSAIHDLDESPAGTLWIIAYNRLLQRRNGELETLGTGRRYSSVLAASDGTVWVGTEQGAVEQWRGGRKTDHRLPRGNRVWALAEDRHGGIWFGSSANPQRWFGGRFENPLHAYAPPPADPRNTRTVIEDREGNIWFGGASGLRRLRPSPFTGVSVPKSYGATSRTVAADRDGRLWVALQNSALLRFENGEFTQITGLSGLHADSVALARDGSLWAAGRKKLWRIRDGGANVELIDEALGPGANYALLEDSRRHLWIGRGDHLSRRTPDGIDRWSAKDGMPGGNVLALLESPRGDVWVGAVKGICRIVGDRVEQTLFAGKDLPPGAVRGLHEDAEGRLWAGTYGGGLCRVTRTGDVAFVGTSHGLYEGVVSRIVDAGEGNLILQGNRAISLVPLQQLNDVADGVIPRIAPRIFKSGPGIDVFEGMGGSTPQSCRTDEGAFWFPALEGLVRFDPSALTPVEAPPHVVIESVLVHGRDYGSAQSLTIPPGQRDLEIRFSAPSFVDPELVQFRYSLENYQGEVVERGVRSAKFTQVPPGSYTFRVSAANRDGIWSAEDASISMVLRPWFHETAWFKALLALLLGASAIGGLLFWTRNARRRAEKLESLVAGRTDELKLEVQERRRAEEKLRDARDHLEEKVDQRTVELAMALRSLQEDLGKRRELERQLNESQKFEAIGRLAGGVAHDFNNILTAILTESHVLLNLLDGGETDPERREGLQLIRDAGQRAARLTDQLLAYARKQLLRPEIINPNDTIAELEGMLRPLVRDDIELSLHLDPGVQCVNVDPAQLGQVMMNLVSNASDATPRGGCIRVATSSASCSEQDVAQHPDASPGPHVLISVTDNGSGIDAETIDRIFEPFFTTKPPGKGTGLGLSSVDGIVQQSGGFIRVDSEPGAGTTFRIYLPEVEGQPEHVPTVVTRERPEGEVTVLLCDDAQDIRQTTSHLLASAGYRVLIAESPQQALELGHVHRDEIEILITDIVMPDMTGIELAARLCTLRADLRVLYISGYSPEPLTDNDEIDIAAQFLRKPFDSESLLRRVADLLVRS